MAEATKPNARAGAAPAAKPTERVVDISKGEDLPAGTRLEMHFRDYLCTGKDEAWLNVYSVGSDGVRELEMASRIRGGRITLYNTVAGEVEAQVPEEIVMLRTARGDDEMRKALEGIMEKGGVAIDAERERANPGYKKNMALVRKLEEAKTPEELDAARKALLEGALEDLGKLREMTGDMPPELAKAVAGLGELQQLCEGALKQLEERKKKADGKGSNNGNA